jgi:CTD kinase subunit gamma
MNNRANIFYFIEHLCEMAIRENHMTFVQNIRRDIFRIVDAVAPSDGSGAANVKVVRKVSSSKPPFVPTDKKQGLPKLQQQSVLTMETVTELEAALKEREVSMSHAGLSPIETDGRAAVSSAITPKPNGVQKLDKRQIEQRIEEDRERHKRLKESIWGVGGDDHEESDKMWDEGSDIGEDDLLAAEEETADMLGVAIEDLRKDY